MEGRDLSLNHTRVKQTVYLRDGLSVETHKSWMGSLGLFIKSGTSKQIGLSAFATDRENCCKLVEELRKDEIGYLVCNPKLIDVILSSFDLEFLRTAKTAMWIPFGEHLGPHLIDALSNLSIPIRGNYSAEEVGMIGAECPKVSGHYHIATSNVIVELVDRSYDIEGIQVGKVLVTHLHSYATPFFRYDVGDLACLKGSCPCGHDGPTIYNLQGRVSRVLKHADGRLSPFYVTGTDLAAVADFTEYRMRQIAYDKILIEFGARSELSSDEIAAIVALLKQRAGEEFSIEVKAYPQIDWGESRKKPSFRCEI